MAALATFTSEVSVVAGKREARGSYGCLTLNSLEIFLIEGEDETADALQATEGSEGRREGGSNGEGHRGSSGGESRAGGRRIPNDRRRSITNEKEDFDLMKEQRTRDDELDKSVYVGNLPFTLEAATLETHLCSIGACTVELKNRNGKFAGFAIATFGDVDTATKAVEGLHDTEFEGRKLLVRYDNSAAA